MASKSLELCVTPYCKNKRDKKRRKCSKCRKKEYRAKYPLQACYQDLRSNAKRRKKIFTISFEYFKSFVSENDYMRLKGKTKYSLSIDRIKNHLGYIEGNIRTITLSDNSRKGTKTGYRDGCPF